MYQPDYIKIRNFGSIAKLDYTFKKGSSILIQGKNLEDLGQKANGAGKSSFNDAIGFSLTGLSLRNLNNEELIRDNENECSLELSLTTIDQSKNLVIKRFLTRKKSQVIQIYLNGHPVYKDDHDVNARNQLVFNELGITKEDLLQFFIISKDRFKPYFKMSDNEKKNITSRFSNADSIDKVFPKLDKDLDKSLQNEKECNVKITSTKAKLETYQEEKENYVNSSSQEQKDQLLQLIHQDIETNTTIIEDEDKYIGVLQADIAIQKDRIGELKIKLGEDEKTLAEKENLLKLLDEEKDGISSFFDNTILYQQSLEEAIVEQQKKTSKELSVLNDDIYQTKQIISLTTAELSSSINCPSCKHEFILESDKTVDELKTQLKEAEDVLKLVEAEKSKKEDEQTVLKKKLKERQDFIQNVREDKKKALEDNIKQEAALKTFILSIKKQISNIETEIKNANIQISNIETTIAKKENFISTIENKIVNLKQEIIDIENDETNLETIERYTKLIEEKEKELKVLEDELEVHTHTTSRINAWIIRFKSFKSYLANQSIKNIEDLSNYYLGKMNSDLSIEISPKSKKGKVEKEKITEMILRNGFPVGSYGRFSGGEKGRIDLGLILANKASINSNAHTGLDFLLIDEIMESLDSLGIENIIRAMDNINTTLLLVTQIEINTLPNQTLTLVKQNGETLISN